MRATSTSNHNIENSDIVHKNVDISSVPAATNFICLSTYQYRQLPRSVILQSVIVPNHIVIPDCDSMSYLHPA